jgi:hypothetical protein
MLRFRFMAAVAVSLLTVVAAQAQVTPAAGFTPPDDTPSYRVGATIFGDYTFIDSPTTKDADNNTIHSSSFNISRAYVNVTGNLNHLIAYRITPDVTRETGTGSSLNGSLTFRLKYAFGQLNLDDWTTKGSWVRFGIQQTPYVDYTEGIYRYRFQGQIFAERVGLLTSSDAGLSGHYNFASNYGDVHVGYYNGEGYNKVETNNEKAIQVRASVRPLPMGGIFKGLRLTGFFDDDHAVASAKRQRAIGQLTFEHPLINLGVDIAQSKDAASATKATVSGSGWSVWATPRLGLTGWELLLRHDDWKPNKDVSSQTQKRNIFGIAYWFQHPTKVQAALMADYDSQKQANFSPTRADDTRYGLKMLINF